MKFYSSPATAIAVLALAAGALLPVPAAAQPAPPAWESGKWEFAATIYGYVPAIEGTINYAGDPRTSDIRVNEGNVLSHLKMAFMGALDAHYGRWGIFNDLAFTPTSADPSRNRVNSRPEASQFPAPPPRT